MSLMAEPFACRLLADGLLYAVCLTTLAGILAAGLLVLKAATGPHRKRNHFRREHI